MPILYVHGVNVRSRDGFLAMKVFARRYIAPVISDDPDGVTIDDAYWGEHAFSPAFDGASRPQTRLFGMGAESLPGAEEAALAAIDHYDTLERLPDMPPPAQSGGGLSSGGLAAGGAGADEAGPAVALQDLSTEDVAELVMASLSATQEDEVAQARAAVVVDGMVADGTLELLVTANEDLDAQLDAIFEEVETRQLAEAELAGMGLSDWVAKARDRAREALSRAKGAPSYAMSIALAEARPKINRLASQFLGDVFVYLDKRGQAGAPGVVPQIVLDKLVALQAVKEARGGEPLIVITHSMGGQLVYDVVSHFLPKTPELSHIHVDFWCTSASQVGFFEEGKLFLESDPAHVTGNMAPFPGSNLGYWWNVYDQNDFLSFTCKEIFEGVDDEAYDSGMTLIKAHGGYLKRPSFFRRMAEKIEAAAASGGGGLA